MTLLKGFKDKLSLDRFKHYISRKGCRLYTYNLKDFLQTNIIFS